MVVDVTSSVGEWMVGSSLEVVVVAAMGKCGDVCGGVVTVAAKPVVVIPSSVVAVCVVAAVLMSSSCFQGRR